MHVQYSRQHEYKSTQHRMRAHQMPHARERVHQQWCKRNAREHMPAYTGIACRCTHKVTPRSPNASECTPIRHANQRPMWCYHERTRTQTDNPACNAPEWGQHAYASPHTVEHTAKPNVVLVAGTSCERSRSSGCKGSQQTPTTELARARPRGGKMESKRGQSHAAKTGHQQR